MNILDGSVTYLIGSIEYSNDDGVGWRQHVMNLCWDSGLRIKFLDPCNKPVKIAGEIGVEKDRLTRLKQQGKFDEIAPIINYIRRVDLRFVDYSDFVIAYIDPSIPTWGSADEIFVAEREHKPILCIVKGGKTKIPVWLIDVIRPEEIFDSPEDLVSYLTKINTGALQTDKRWVLIRKELDEIFAQQAASQEKRLIEKVALLEQRIRETANFPLNNLVKEVNKSYKGPYPGYQEPLEFGGSYDPPR
jgi:nucleoside 2-deoxyribosyltransferase